MVAVRGHSLVVSMVGALSFGDEGAELPVSKSGVEEKMNIQFALEQGKAISKADAVSIVSERGHGAEL